MPRTSDKRERLIQAACNLIHQQGFAQTTLADIAEASAVPLGNVYYYFKTKDELVGAVIDGHIEALSGQLRDCEHRDCPRERLLGFIDMVRENSQLLAECGCAYGSLCQELDKRRGLLSEKADRAIGIMLEWATAQFRALGRKDAEDLAFDYVSRLQGIGVVGHSLHDAGLIEHQLDLLADWLRQL